VTRYHPLAFGVNVGKFGRDVKAAAVRYDLGPAADGVDGYLVAAFDSENGLQFGLEEAPMAGFGAGIQVMMFHDGASALS